MPPTITRISSCLVTTASVPSAPPSESDPTSPMKTSAGMGVVPEEAEAGAEQRAAEDDQLAASRDIQDLEIIGDDLVPAQVHDYGVCRRGDADQPDGQTVQAVGQVDGVGRADDDDHDKRNVEPAQVDEQLLHERHGQMGAVGVAGWYRKMAMATEARICRPIFCQALRPLERFFTTLR